MRGVVVVFLLLVGPAATAAPPPKESDTAKLKRLWGETVDPKADCKFTLDDTKLKIGIPASRHPLSFMGIFNERSEESVAPRMAKEWSGDFTFEVKIPSSYPVGSGVSAGVAGAGVYISSDLKNTFFIARQHAFSSTGEVTSSTFRYYGRSPRRGSSSTRNVPDKDAKDAFYLQLIREGQRIKAATSDDGKTWKQFGNFEGEFTDPVKLGVFAEQTGERTYEATFDAMKITKPEAK